MRTRAGHALLVSCGPVLQAASVLSTLARLAMPRTRPAIVPPHVRTVTVGGATLGGSGKTRVAIAVSKVLADRGERVVLIGHAHRARPGIARIVSPDDRIDVVGDEAIVCARALDGVATVVVAPSRQEAIDYAVAAVPEVTVLVFDGPLQLRPRRATLSILAVDASDPAPPRSLVAHADEVIAVDSRPTPEDIARLSGKRFGLFTAIARPRRLVDALRREGLVPTVTVEVSDHGPVTASARKVLATAEVDLWVSTPKCALHLKGARVSASAPPRMVLSCLDPPRASALILRSTP